MVLLLHWSKETFNLFWRRSKHFKAALKHLVNLNLNWKQCNGLLKEKTVFLRRIKTVDN